MLDLKFVLANLGEIEEVLKKRKSNVEVLEQLKKIKDLASRRNELITRVQKLKTDKNKVSNEVAGLKKQKVDSSELIAKMKEVSSEIKILDSDLSLIEEEINNILLDVPNTLHQSVPIGYDENSNVEIKRWGKIKKFDFNLKDHVQLGENLGLLDFETAAIISGSRFVVYKKELARLERALINFMIDIHTKNGYEEIMPPFLVNSASMTGTGQLPKFSADSFKIEDSDLWLIPTGEVPVTNIYRNKILKENELPLSYVTYTPCFRKEAGSYGKDIRGIIRQHQFNKVELVKFSRPEDSMNDFEKLISDAEIILQKLDLPYRIMKLCSGDIGANAHIGYDIEVWLPGQNKFREISSCSLFNDYQSRRANIKFKTDVNAKPRFVHTINGSGLAVGRTVVAIMENYQEKDGSIAIPDVLVDYMGGINTISPLKM